HAFMTKFSVFIAVALLSVVPTLEFLSWRKELRAGKLPSPTAEKLRFIRKIIHGELAAIIVILLCAAIMARGGCVKNPATSARKVQQYWQRRANILSNSVFIAMDRRACV